MAEAAPRAAAIPGVRERWRMGIEARALVLLTAVLLAFGLAVLYSASWKFAPEHASSAYFLFRQLTGLAAGAVAFAVAAKLDAERWRQWAWPMMIVTIVCMLVIILPFTESIAPRINGSRRFLIGTSVQPSEIGKLAVVMWTAMLLVKKGDQMRRLTKGLLPFLIVIGLLDVLAALEPDLSVSMMYTLMAGIILFAGGARVGHFVVVGLLATPLLVYKMRKLEYALMRMMVFFQSGETHKVEKAQAAVTYQLKQSLIAVGSGGPFGTGFGQGRQQYGYVPFAYDDFIASNVGEEWGFIGILFLVLAFAAYGWLGFRIARNARSPFLQLVAVGLTITTVITAYLHIGVVIGLLPTTGLTLPFISYGRSNLVLTLFMTGILANIGSTRERIYGAAATDPLAAQPA
jgi:cell division protein FtsW